jgi:hypothetical protein
MLIKRIFIYDCWVIETRLLRFTCIKSTIETGKEVLSTEFRRLALDLTAIHGMINTTLAQKKSPQDTAAGNPKSVIFLGCTYLVITR